MTSIKSRVAPRHYLLKITKSEPTAFVTKLLEDGGMQAPFMVRLPMFMDKEEYVKTNPGVQVVDREKQKMIEEEMIRNQYPDMDPEEIQ